MYFTRHIADINTHRIYIKSVYCGTVIKRSSGHKRYYPPQFKHPPRIAAARVLRDNLLPERTALAERARLCADEKTQLDESECTKQSPREKDSQVVYSSAAVQFKLLGYSSGQAVISDTIPPSSNTLCG